VLIAATVCYWAKCSRPEGDVRTEVAGDGAPPDDDPHLYDQAFALLALASAAQTGV
jgi:mannose/cellobiose epimerase-like protein (N-acyl-D-glucosamine 2-epimerase family)